MTQKVVYVALQQFCEQDERPRQVLLQAGFRVFQNAFGRRLRREEMLEILRNADAICAGVEPYDAPLLASLPRLRCISRCGAGTDSIDLEATRRQGITVCTTIDETVEPVAQMTVAMILSLARNFPLHIDDFRKWEWRKRSGFLLSEWTIGLVGFGRIGRAVERHLRSFGPRVVVTDPALHADDVPLGVEVCSLPTLLSQSDVVSLHASCRRSDPKLMGPFEIEKMKAGSRLINTARGYLVDEVALEKALRSGHCSAAALDVFEQEPYRGSLIHLPNVLCTPHVSTLTRASRVAMEFRCAQNVVDFFAQF